MEKKILVADIDENVMLMMEAALSVKGFYVTTARSGKEAFNRIRKEHPDIVILDTALPEISGYQVVQKMRGAEDLKKIPVIIMSEKAQMRELFTSAEIHAFLVKPVVPKVLMKEIESAFKPGSRQGAKENNIVAAISLEGHLFDKVKSYLLGKGCVIIPDPDVDKILQSRPKLVIAPYLEGPGGGPAGEIFRELKRRKQTHFVPFYALCPEPLLIEAIKEIPSDFILRYKDAGDMCDQLGSFLNKT